MWLWVGQGMWRCWFIGGMGDVVVNVTEVDVVLVVVGGIGDVVVLVGEVGGRCW